MKEYRFIDHWRIVAPIEAVYNRLIDARTYPAWWPSYDSVCILRNAPYPHVGGRAEFVVRSPFGYRLRLEVEVVAAQPPTYIKTVTTGQLAGVGIWELAQRDATTYADFTWIVRSDHPLLNRLEGIAKPAFALSHVIASRRGQRGLKRLLEPQLALDPFPIP